jgi:hypothetical protein
MNHNLNYPLIPNTNPYTIVEWGILSLYGFFLYRLTTMITNQFVVCNESINENQENGDKNQATCDNKPKSRCIIIVKRAVKSASIDKKLRKQIAIHLKENGFTRPYFLSTFSNPDYNKLHHESRIAHEILNTFLIKLYKTNHSLVIMNRNDYEWEYEPYITLCEMNNIHIEMAYA